MAQHGGARPGAGRRKGQVSEAKRDLASMAQEHAVMALQTLADIAREGESETARVSASNSILDRAYGKPVQGVELGGKDGAALRVVFETVYEAPPTR